MPDSPGSDLVIRLGDLADVNRGEPSMGDILVFNGTDWEPATFPAFPPEELPEVPATPTAQNIVDALVTLGLVTQAEA